MLKCVTFRVKFLNWRRDPGAIVQDASNAAYSQLGLLAPRLIPPASRYHALTTRLRLQRCGRHTVYLLLIFWYNNSAASWWQSRTA